MDYTKEVKALRQKRECLFKDVKIECKSQGKFSTENNHLISKSSYLKRISEKNQVMVFVWEERDYYKKHELSKRNIKSANTYRVLCGNHDKLLFNKIENGNPFDRLDSEQHFQFALRAFLFYYSHCEIKQVLPKIASKPANAVSKANYSYDQIILKKFKKIFLNKNWSEVKTTIIELDRKIEFVSCFYFQPFFNIDLPLTFIREKVAINVFPEEDKTIILLSYLPSKSNSIERYCNRLQECAKKDEMKFVRYINKLVIAFDPNITINPLYWNNLDEKAKKSFYDCALCFKKNKTVLAGIIKVFKLFNYDCKCNLI